MSLRLARRLGDKNTALHQQQWDKSLAGAHEVRGHSIGLIGYGHIGQQVGLLAEAFGMRVLYYDIAKKLALGLARPVAELDELLEQADFVSLHVPETPRTVAMIGQAQLARMRPGSYLLNLSRGKVVDPEALREALGSGHLGGAALDVYKAEPTPTVAEFDVGFAGLPNVILTPHVGGNTEEAQRSHRPRGGARPQRIHRSRLHRRRGELPAGEPAGDARHATASSTSIRTSPGCWRRSTTSSRKWAPTSKRSSWPRPATSATS